MEDLFDGIKVSNPSDALNNPRGGGISVDSHSHQDYQSGDEMGIQPILRDGEDLQSAKKRIKKQIRISKRQMLEPLKVVGRLQHLTQSESRAHKEQIENEEIEQYESLLDMSEKMGQ